MFKVGDKVIVTKNTINIKNIDAIVDSIDYNTEYYRVRHNYGRNGIKNNYCNIFYNHIGESIELDLREIRNDKLKNLGI